MKGKTFRQLVFVEDKLWTIEDNIRKDALAKARENIPI